MMRHGEAGARTDVTAERGAATERVRMLPVTVVAEPDAPLCGCSHPRIQWSSTYTGGGTRRAYWLCGICLATGFLLFPAETANAALELPDGVSRAAAETGLAELAEIVGEHVDVLRLYTRHADDLLSRRSEWTEARVVASAREALDQTLAELRQRADAFRMELAVAESHRASAHARKMADLQRMIDRRKGAARTRLARRPAPSPDASYPTIAEGRAVLGRIIYGLIDPRDPQRIRYVGKTIRGPHQRLAQHIADAQYRGVKADWLRALSRDELHPDMVLLETVRPEGDIDARERWWIHEMRKQGQADLNSTAPPLPLEHRPTDTVTEVSE